MLTNTEVISFRHMLSVAVERFLEQQDLQAPGLHEEVAEGIVALAHYREEGTALFPALFFCRELGPMLTLLDATDPVTIGKAPLGPATVRRVIKQCAPLCTGTWAVFLVRDESQYTYGVFRADEFALRTTFMARLRSTAKPRLPVLGVVQLADNVLELRCSGGAGQLVHLSGARTDGTPVLSVFAAFTRAFARDVDPHLRGDVEAFFRRVLIDAMRASHGCLIAVVPPGGCDLTRFRDGVLLEEPVSIAERIGEYVRAPSTESRARVQALVPLLTGMLSSDGITLLGSDGAIVGFNVFLHSTHDEGAAGTAGGARQRTYRALASLVGDTLRGAFIRSQDGFADCTVSETPAAP